MSPDWSEQVIAGMRSALAEAELAADDGEIPVVASRIAGVPEIVIEAETGYMVEPGDVADLTSGIVKLAADADTRRRMGENGRVLVTRSHDKHAQFDAFLEHFRQITH